ncbi:unnamed protein product, partial [Effrenium voratum]
SEEDDTAEKIEEVKEYQSEQTEKNINRAECGVNYAQGVLFIGRAALELNGVFHHCQDQTDHFEQLRCGANAQGALAAFAVTSHVFADATAQCMESYGKDYVEAFCAGAISQILHATTELTAALTLLADACVMTAGLYPYGRKKD